MEKEPNKSSTLHLLLRTALCFFLIGGCGALCGTALIKLLNGGTLVQGKNAGHVFLFVSACLAFPGSLFMGRRKGKGERFDSRGEQER